MQLIYKEEHYVRGKGKILLFEREDDTSRHPKIGEKITVNGKRYVVTGVEFMRNLLNYGVNSDIGVVVRDADDQHGNGTNS